MNQRLAQWMAQLKSVWTGLPPQRRLVMLGAAGLVFLSLAALTLSLRLRPGYEVLFSRLHAQDAALVLAELEGAGIPYKIEQDSLGRAVISVPRDVVYRTRISLAAEGIPRQGSVGFEIFDESQLGMTDDIRRINLRRALNGELERTIRAMDAIEDARVQVAIPENRLFISQQEKPTAAVMLTLKPGYRLTAEQVSAIQRLVGATIEGLDPSDVFVVDNRGNPLSDQLSRLEDATGLTAVEKQILIQQALSNEYSRQIRSMLERVFGVGRVEAMVTVRLNFESVEEVVKAFEAPNGRSGIPRSEQILEETFSGVGQPLVDGGVPGVESNVPGYTGILPTGESEFSRFESIVNYEINEIQTRRMVPAGAIRSMSVGVWIDGNLSDEQERAIANTLSSALGLDPARGDQILVDSMPFATAETLAAATAAPTGLAWESTYAYILASAVLLVITGLLLWRTRQRRLAPARVDVTVGEELSPAAVPSPEEQRRQQVREKVAILARERPHEVAQLLKTWLVEE